MKILDRYIIKSVVFIFLATIVLFCLLYLLIDSASNLDEFINRKIPISIIIQYYITYLPILLTQTSAFACLLAAMLTYSNLNTNNEIIALRSSGLSFWKITQPVLCFAIIVSACVFFINERYIPRAEIQAEKIRNENMILESDRKRKKKAKIKDLTFYGLKRRLYHISAFDPNTHELSGITIVGYNDQQLVIEKIVALRGIWTGIAWKFLRCHISTTTPEGTTQVRVYKEKLMDIKETPQDFLKQRLNVTAMNIKQLRSYIDRFSKSGAERALNNLRVDLHHKIAFPFANFIIVLAGLPFALMTGRRKAQTFLAIGISITLGFLYYVLNAVGLALGKGGLFPPFFAAWMTPLCFTAMAYYFIKTRF